jgi:hypothetical protein
LIHVEDIFVSETFDVFGEGYEFFDVGVLAGGMDGVVDYYAVDGGVGVCGEDGVFDFFFGDYAEVEFEAAVVYVNC